MSVDVVSRPEPARLALAARLNTRREELERAILSRAHGVSDPTQVLDLEYVEGLRAAVAAAVDYGLASIEFGDDDEFEVPVPLLAQARLAARVGVSLDTVLRRYIAGFALLGDFVIQEAENGSPLGPHALQRMRKVQAAHFDRLVAAVSREFERELQAGRQLPPLDKVKRRLAGEPVDLPEFAYDFDGHHLGAIASGAGAAQALRDLFRMLDCNPMLVPADPDVVWAWLGSRRPLDFASVDAVAREMWPEGVALALGAPGEGHSGWRLTHRQAEAALPIAMRGPKPCVHYRDVVLLAATIRDDVLASSLRQLYLAPLANGPSKGETLRETLRAYLAANYNVSSSAAALGVNRHTVTNRLRSIEELLGRPISSCAAELDAALRLADLREDDDTARRAKTLGVEAFRQPGGFERG